MQTLPVGDLTFFFFVKLAQFRSSALFKPTDYRINGITVTARAEIKELKSTH